MVVGTGSSHRTGSRSGSSSVGLVQRLSLVDVIVSLLIGFVLIYVGAVILWSLNPFFAVLFVLAALYIVGRSLLKGGEGI